MSWQSLGIQHTAGIGNKNLILIHNAGGSAHMFTNQVQLLRNYGDVYQFDLPGHGDNVASPLSADITSCADLIAELAKGNQLKRLVPVGLNNGANIILEAQARHPQLFEMLVLIDPFIMMSKGLVDEIKAFIAQMACHNSYESFVENMIEALLPISDASIKKIPRKAFLAVNKNALKDMIESLIQWDQMAEQKLSSVDVPTLCLLTDEHHCTYQALRAHAPQIHLGKTVGARCWAPLEVPDQVNAMLSRFLELHGSDL